MRYGLMLGIFLGCISNTSLAETERAHEGEHREFEAHEHGIAEINWVMEGRNLSLSLHSPVMNMLGFEHKPQNEHENKQLTLLMATLTTSDKVIELKGGQCSLLSSKIENPFVAIAQDEEGEPTFGEDRHNDHNNIIVEYNFLCQDPLELETLNITLFDTFAGFELIHVQWIINGNQRGLTLNHDNHLLKVR